MKADMKNETKKGVYLNIPSLSFWTKLLRVLNLFAEVLIHQRSRMDSRTESFITLYKYELSYIYAFLTHCPQELDSASNISRERFLLESVHCRKIVSQLSIVPLLPPPLSPLLCCLMTQINFLS